MRNVVAAVVRIFHVFLLYFPMSFFLGKLGLDSKGIISTVVSAFFAVFFSQFFLSYFKSLGESK